MQDSNETGVVDTGAQAQLTEQPQVAAKKPAKSGSLIVDVASEVEGLTKLKALNEAQRLAENIETGYFKLGGVLKVIYENGWFEGYETFDKFVFEKFGFQSRKAKYLMEIYESLVTKQIPWEKVSEIGWTKLKDLAKVLTIENVDEWVAKAKVLTVEQLQAVLKGGAVEGEGSPSAKTADDVQTVKFKLKNDQVQTVQEALNKAKAETGTEFDNVALEMICVGYLGGSVSVSSGSSESLEDQIKAVGPKAALELIDSLYPDLTLTVEGLPE